MEISPIFYQEKRTSKRKLISAGLIYATALLAAVLLPVILWQMKLPIISRTYDGSVAGMLDSQPFELFGLFMSALLFLIAWFNIKRQKKLTVATATPIVLSLLVSLQILFLMVGQAHFKASDYMCYEKAAQALVDGLNPYSQTVKCYLYPPLQAQVLALLYQWISWGLRLPPQNSHTAWTIVFYFYYCANFFQILLAYYLTYLLAQRMGLKVIPAIVLTSALFLFDNSLFRTIQFDQINAWVLNCFLLSVLWLPRHPWLSGLAVALGAHIKLYTFALLLPWTLTKQWRAVLGVVAGFVAILLVQTSLGANWVPWQEFVGYFFERVEKPTNYRNNGIWSVTYNLAKIPASTGNTSFFALVPIIVAAINLLLVVWFTIRVFQREQAYAELVKADSAGKRSNWNKLYRLYGHSIDTIALGLLISPSVWEHHYILAIPVALWAIATRRFDQPWASGLGACLIFSLPTFDVFLLSDHQLIGLLLLVYLTNPQAVKNYFASSKVKSFACKKFTRMDNLHLNLSADRCENDSSMG